MKLLFNYLLVSFLSFIVLTMNSCGNDEEVNPDDSFSTDTTAILADIQEGMGKVAVFGDTNFVWQKEATWKSTTDINSGGRTYSRWIVTLKGETQNEKVKIQIVENKQSSAEDGPDDGTYILGGSMDENDIAIYTVNDSYFFDASSLGSFTLTKDANGEVFNIELEADNLEIGGIGTQDAHVDINAAIKAGRE